MTHGIRRFKSIATRTNRPWSAAVQKRKKERKYMYILKSKIKDYIKYYIWKMYILADIK